MERSEPTAKMGIGEGAAVGTKRARQETSGAELDKLKRESEDAQALKEVMTHAGLPKWLMTALDLFFELPATMRAKSDLIVLLKKCRDAMESDSEDESEDDDSSGEEDEDDEEEEEEESSEEESSTDADEEEDSS